MMSKRNVGEELIQGMHEAIDIAKGKKKPAVIHKVRIPENIDVRTIRDHLKLSRTEFAAQFGFSPRTLQHWEQGDRRPQGAARILLLLLQRDSETIKSLLQTKPMRTKKTKAH